MILALLVPCSNKTLGYLVKSSEGFSLFCCLVNINNRRQSFIRLLSQDLFHDSNTDTDAFSFVTVYINLRQIWQCLRYSPGRPFWHHFVCIWPLKRNKVCLFNLVLATRTLDVTERTEKESTSTEWLKRRENNKLLPCNNDQLGNCQLHQNLS